MNKELQHTNWAFRRGKHLRMNSEYLKSLGAMTLEELASRNAVVGESTAPPCIVLVKNGQVTQEGKKRGIKL